MTSHNQPTARSEPAWLHTLITVLGVCCIAVLGYWALQPPGLQTPGFEPRAVEPCVMDRDGYLRGEIYGGIRRQIDWQGKQMRCDGMWRPDGAGMRFVFAEHADENKPGLLVVFGIAAAEPGQELNEAPVNITVIDQERGLFFSTPEEPRCWTKLGEQLQLTGTVQETWRIDGEVYCVGALPALNGSGTVTLGDIAFSGVFKPAVE